MAERLSSTPEPPALPAPVAAGTIAAASTSTGCPPPSGGRRERRRERMGLVVLSAAAGVSALVVSAWLFPLYSINRDDSVYVAMARLLERGTATLPASSWPFRPWASGLVGDHITMKYAPPWPSVLAIADLVTGSFRVGLALTAAATVVAVRALAYEVLQDRAAAFAAAVLLVVSPIFFVQSGTYLPYVFSLLLAVATVALVLAGIRLGSRRHVALAGALAAVAVFARPYDALLLVVPLVVALALSGRRAGRSPGRWAGVPFVAGALPVLAMMLSYDAVTMGSPTRLPFSVTGPADGFGFGRRGVFASSTIRFDVADGWSGTGACLRWMVTWLAGGPLLVVLAVIGALGVLRRGSGVGRWVVASWVAIVPLGYIAFWGPWAMSHNWDGVESLGPYYHLPLVVPAVVFGAEGAVSLLRRHRRAGIAALVAMGALTVVALPDKISINDRTTADFRAAQRAVRDAGLDDAILFLPLRGESGFLSVTPFLENRPDLDQPVLYAEDCGAGADALVLARFPGRRGYRLDITSQGDRRRPASYVVRPLDAPWPGSEPRCGA